MTTVVYIAGKGRSGSTLLDRLLGHVPGVFSAGELWRLWHDAPTDRRCECGETLAICPIWSVVLDRGAGRGRDRTAMVAMQRRLFTWRALPRIVVTRRRWPLLDEYATEMRAVYGDIAELTGASHVVDSSKWPLDPTLLTRNQGDVRLIHLVRDLRAVVHSWQRHKQFTDRAEPEDMPRFGTMHSAASWRLRNIAVDRVARIVPSLRVRYEDLAGTPDATLRRIADFAGFEAPASSDGGSHELVRGHTVAGNPNRMTSGRIDIVADEAWRTEMSPRRRRLVGVLGWPALGRYGYE